MNDTYSRLRAEQQSGIPWSEMICLLEEQLNQPKAYVEEMCFGEQLSAVDKARRDNDPLLVADEKEVRMAIKRYRMGRHAPISQKAGNNLFFAMESRGIVQRDQDGNIYILRQDATFTKLT